MSPMPRFCRSAVGVALYVLLTLSRSSAAPTTYFVRESGDDAARGDSTNAAWRSIERVTRADLQPGDHVFFEAGKSFRGNLVLSAEDSGTSNAPVVIGSFGTGRATLLAGESNGIAVIDAGGVTIENLVITGAGRTNNSGYGILCDNRLETGERLKDLRIQNVEVSGFGVFGILVSGDRSGFAHIRVVDCVMRDNLRGGMEVAGRLSYNATNYAHADVQVSRCQAFNNTGDPNYLKNHSGSGIVLYQVDDGVIEHCQAWNNGAECRSKSGGGVGLWTCASRRIVIQYCESFANRTSGADGGGFDLDGGSVDCVLQYNYSHDNDGPGLMVYTYAYASHIDRGNVVRFNISENDSRKSRKYAGLWVSSDGPRMSGVEIFNNTVVIGPWTDQAALIHGHEVEVSVRNNIFVSHGAAVPLLVTKPHDRLRFEGNLYWREGAPVQVAWGNQIYTRLAEWRENTGQELVVGKPTGFWESPQLSSHAPGLPASARIGLESLRAFRPLAASPAIASGLNLRTIFGVDGGGRDFFGRLLPRFRPWTIGVSKGGVAWADEQ